MCIAFWSLDHPYYSLIVASNRDEYLSRPTFPSQWHHFQNSHSNLSPIPTETSPDDEPLERTPSQEHPILSAIDLSHGGTWLGLSHDGKLALLTNYAEVKPTTEKVSRGDLVRRFLTGGGDWVKRADDHDDVGGENIGTEQGMKRFLERADEHKDDYAGFNLLVGQLFLDPESSRSSVPSTARTACHLGLVTNREPGYESRLLTSPGAEEEEKEKEKEKKGWNSGKYGSSRLFHHSSTPDGSSPTQLRSSSSSTHREEWDETRTAGLSNGCFACATDLMDEGAVKVEKWKKVSWGEELFKKALDLDGESAGQVGGKEEEALVERLFGVLSTRSPDPATSRANLRDTILVPPFHPDPTTPGLYGTRTQTLILASREGGEILWIERDGYVLRGDANEEEEAVWSGKQRRYRFKLGSA